MKRLLLVGLLAIGITGLALSQTGQGGNGNGQGGNGNGQGAPEINPNQAVSALALLSGGLLVVRRKKK